MNEIIEKQIQNLERLMKEKKAVFTTWDEEGNIVNLRLQSIHKISKNELSLMLGGTGSMGINGDM